MSDSKIEGNHWDADSTENENNSNDSKETTTDSMEILGLLVLIGVLLSILMSMGYMINATETNPEYTEVTTDKDGTEVTVTIENVDPHFEYVIVETETSRELIYSQRELTYDISDQNINSISVVGFEQESRLYSEDKTQEVFLREIDVNSLS